MHVKEMRRANVPATLALSVAWAPHEAAAEVATAGDVRSGRRCGAIGGGTSAPDEVAHAVADMLSQLLPKAVATLMPMLLPKEDLFERIHVEHTLDKSGSPGAPGPDASKGWDAMLRLETDIDPMLPLRSEVHKVDTRVLDSLSVHVARLVEESQLLARATDPVTPDTKRRLFKVSLSGSHDILTYIADLVTPAQDVFATAYKLEFDGTPPGELVLDGTPHLELRPFPCQQLPP